MKPSSISAPEQSNDFVTPTVNNQVQAEALQKQNTLLKILIGVLGMGFLLIVSALAFLIYQQKGLLPEPSVLKNNVTKNNDAPILTTKATPTVAPTSVSSAETWQERSFNNVKWSTTFKSFKLSYPSSWSLSESHITEPPESLEVILAKGTTTLTITQSPGGGGYCVYPGDETLGMATNNNLYSEIRKTNSILWRITYIEKNNPYIVCSKDLTTDNDYFMSTTEIGSIKIEDTSNKYDDKTLNEINQILDRVQFLN